MGAQLRTGLPAADEVSISAISGRLSIKPQIYKNETNASITASSTETVLSQVTIPANSSGSYLFITAIVGDSHASGNGTFRIRIGAAGTIADTQIGQAYVISSAVTSSLSTIVCIAVRTTNYDGTVQNIVSVTGKNNNIDASSCTVYNLAVIGV
jgi:hypothetical protein